MAFTLEVHLARGCGAVIAGPRLEQPPRSLVVGRDGRIHVTDVAAGGPFEYFVEHASGQALPAGFIRYGDLPYEERVGLGRGDVGGDEADQAFPPLAVLKNRGDRGAAEMRAMQKIAIEGIRVQRRAFCDESVQSCSVV